MKHPQSHNESINTIYETPNSQFRLVFSVTQCMPHTGSLKICQPQPSPLLFSPTSRPAYVPTPDCPKDQLPPPLLSPTNSSTSFHNTSSQRDETLSRSPDYLAPPPQVVQFRTSSHHPHLSLKLGLNDPHALEDIIYVIMQALCSQTGAMMCACSSVGAPPHDTCKYYRSLLEVTELDLSSPFKPCRLITLCTAQKG